MNLKRRCPRSRPRPLLRDETGRPYANYTNDEIKQVCAMWAKTKDSDDEELAKRSRLCIRNCQAELAMRRK